MLKRLSTVALCAGLAGAMACGEVEPDPPDSVDDANLSVTVHADSNNLHDVAEIEYKVVPCNDNVDVDPEYETLKDATLPGGFERFQDGTYEYEFDTDSEHAFADHITVKDAGCYDIYVRAVDDEREPIDECEPTLREDVNVVEGQMTEVVLIIQCEGEQRGILDIVAALNHPPALYDFDILDNKFATCPEGDTDVEVEVCAVFDDPEGDPINVEWSPEPDDISVQEDLDHFLYGECATYTLDESVQDYEVSAYDKFADGTPIEDHPDVGESRVTYTYDIHVDCPDPEDVLPTCPEGKDFWETNKGDWPIGDGSGEDLTICSKSWNHIITKEIDDDLTRTQKAFYTLGQQYIAAKLNLASNSEATKPTKVHLFFAKVLLHRCHTWMHPVTRALAYKLADKLQAFNEQDHDDECVEKDPGND